MVDEKKLLEYLLDMQEYLIKQSEILSFAYSEQSYKDKAIANFIKELINKIDKKEFN